MALHLVHCLLALGKLKFLSLHVIAILRRPAFALRLLRRAG